MSSIAIPRCTPEEGGLSSAVLDRYLQALTQSRVNLHSLLLYRHGHILHESYWAPYTAQTLHRMYSVSKSFASMGIGILTGEGKISLDDRVLSFFPDKAPAQPHPYLAAVTIRDLLKMASIHDTTPYDGPHGLDWVTPFFTTQPTHLPGQVFQYDSQATLMCTAILERVTGQSLLDYLRPRLLDPIGFSPDAWCVQSPCGVSWAASGILCTPMDLMKFAITLLQGGKFGGQQLIPADYVREAVSYQIDNHVGSATLQEGYGYQVWRLPQGGFGCVGMGCQLALCYPEQDFILVCTGDTQELGNRQYLAADLFFQLVLPELAPSALPPQPDAEAALQRRSQGLALPVAPGCAQSPVAGRVSGKRFSMQPNALGWKWLQVDQTGDEGVLRYETCRGEHALPFGLGHAVAAEFPETHYSGARIQTPLGRGYRCLTSAGWDAPGSLTLYCYVVDDYLGTLKMDLAFTEDTVTVMSDKVAEWFLDEYVGFASGSLA